MGCFVAFISLFYLAGFYMLGYSLWYAWCSTRAANWPTTPGTITHLAVEETSDEGTSYEVKVRYAYAVDGVCYEGDRLAFGYGSSSGRRAHEEIHRKLQQAQQVAVRYDPSNPTVSCLSYGMHRSIWLGLAFSVTWLLFVFGFTVTMWLFSRGDSVLVDNLSIR
jgi:hypothetical protein